MKLFTCYQTTTRFQYEIYDKIGEIDFLWDNFLAEGHHLRSENLQVLERSQPADLQFSYLLVKEAEQLVGVVYLQEIKFSSKHYDTSAFATNTFLHWISPCVLSQTADLLVCGNLFRMNFTGFEFAQGIAPESIGQILSDYIELRKPEKKYAGIFLKDIPLALNLREVPQISFKAFPDDLTMEMQIRDTWKNMDDYAQSLSKKYRQRLKKTQASAESLERRELNYQEIEQYGEQILSLYMQVVERQSIRIGIINAGYFVEMKRSLGQDFKVVGYFSNGKLVAFASYIFYANQTFEIHYIGFDYTENERYQIYLNVLFDGLALGIATQQKSVELGRTARLAKANLGAKPVFLNGYYAMRLGLPAFVFAVLSYFFDNKMGEDWKVRNPFK